MNQSGICQMTHTIPTINVAKGAETFFSRIGNIVPRQPSSSFPPYRNAACINMMNTTTAAIGDLGIEGSSPSEQMKNTIVSTITAARIVSQFFFVLLNRNRFKFFLVKPPSMQKQAAIVGPNPPIVKITIGNTFDSVKDVTLTSRASPHQQTQVMRNVIIKYFVSLFLSIIPSYATSDFTLSFTLYVCIRGIQSQTSGIGTYAARGNSPCTNYLISLYFPD